MDTLQQKQDWRTFAEFYAWLRPVASTKSVLIVEDRIDVLEALDRALTRLGATTLPVMGIHSLEGRVATGTLNEEGMRRTFELEEVDTVFLDHYFLSTSFDGASFLIALRKVSLARVVAMSSDPGKNRLMHQLGATVALPKQKIIALLASE